MLTQFGKKQTVDDNCSTAFLIGVLLLLTEWQILKIASVNCFSSKVDLTVKLLNSLFAT